MNIKYITFGLASLISIFSLNSHASYSALFEPDVPSGLRIVMSERDQMKFETELEETIKNKSKNQNNSNKNKYTVKIIGLNDNIEKICSGVVRINGDWKDHINLSLKISSLDVKLEKCSFGDIDKFKIFLPETKNNQNEIFWSMLLNEYGFPTLFTKYVDIDLSGKKFRAIFQEKPSTNFLERHSIRETAIVKSDERQIWETIYNYTKLESDPDVARRYDVFKPMGSELVNVDVEYWGGDHSYGTVVNREFLKDNLKIKVANNALSEYRNKSKKILNEKFYQLINNRYAQHGLAEHNRRFAYIPYLNAFVPIYYDGMTNFFEEGSCDKDVGYSPNPEFISKFRALTGTDLSNGMLCAYQEVKKISSLNSWSIQEIFTNEVPIQYARPKVGKLDSGFKNISMNAVLVENGIPFLFKKDKDNAYTSVSESFLKKAMVGNIETHVKGYNISTVAAGEMSEQLLNRSIIIGSETPDKITVADHEKLFVYMDDNKGRKIDVKLLGVGSRVIFTGFVNDEDVIHISGIAPNYEPDNRHDQILLTGCATFINVKFSGGQLSSVVQGCEDAINIIGSNGNINKIDVVGASQDAIDLDFSNLSVEEVVVHGAGNDCLDISTGNYSVGSSSLFNCQDKGISVGERANSKFGNVYVQNSTYGIVAKDQSNVIVESIRANSISKECIASYIKKEKFSSPKIEVNKSDCANRTKSNPLL